MTGPSLPARLVIGLVVVAALAACGSDLDQAVQRELAADMPLDRDPDVGMPPGARHWIIPVSNGGPAPAILLVAEDGPDGPGAIVGNVTPDTVPAGKSVDVDFDVPPGRTWAIFVNPGPDVGPLITATDVPPGAEGRLPLTIQVSAEGPSVTAPGAAGWFGN